jgi:hypothetical protein
MCPVRSVTYVSGRSNRFPSKSIPQLDWGAAICSKHPETGPCQYERNNCRASGGRVFAANGAEITMATEAEYDKKVMRVRFRAN